MATRDIRLNVRLNRLEKEKLDYYAKQKEVTPTEIVRDFIKSLPDPRFNEDLPLD